jgi:hypothetical protein
VAERQTLEQVILEHTAGSSDRVMPS